MYDSKYTTKHPGFLHTTEHFGSTYLVSTTIAFIASLVAPIDIATYQILLPHFDTVQLPSSHLLWSTACFSLTNVSFSFCNSYTGKKRGIVLGFMIYSLAVISTNFARTCTTLCIIRGIQGLASSLALQASLEVVQDCCNESGKDIGGKFASTTLGYLVGTSLAVSSLSYSSCKAALVFLSFVYAICALVSIIFLPENKSDKNGFLFDFTNVFIIFCVIALLVLGSLLNILIGPGKYCIYLLGCSLILVSFAYRTKRGLRDSIGYPGFSMASFLCFIGWSSFGSVYYYASLNWYTSVPNASLYIIPGLLVNIGITLYAQSVSAKVLGYIGSKAFLIIGMTLFNMLSFLWAFLPLKFGLWESIPLPNTIFSLFSVAFTEQPEMSGNTVSTTTWFHAIQLIGNTIGISVAGVLVAEDASVPDILRLYQSACWFGVVLSGFGHMLTIFIQKDIKTKSR